MFSEDMVWDMSGESGRWIRRMKGQDFLWIMSWIFWIFTIFRGFRVLVVWL